MNPVRFVRKCFTDPPAAWASLKITVRGLRKVIHFKLFPSVPLRHRVNKTGVILLERGHPFTLGFYPGVDTYETDVREFLIWALKPGDTFLDCGSNIGFFSILAGTIVGPSGKVLAIDANPEAFKQLQRNLTINGFGKPIHTAITTQAGEVELFMPVAGDTYSSLRTGTLVPKDSQLKSFRVPGRTLDEIITTEGLTRLDVIKLDVEGGELDALRSASASLNHFRPLAIFEYSTYTWPSFGATPAQMQAFADEHRYTLCQFDLKLKSLIPLPSDIWERTYENLILVPQERQSTLRPGPAGGSRA